MADPEAEVNGDTHLSKEIPKGGGEEPMDAEDVDDAEPAGKKGLPADDAMETEENGDAEGMEPAEHASETGDVKPGDASDGAGSTDDAAGDGVDAKDDGGDDGVGAKDGDADDGVGDKDGNAGHDAGAKDGDAGQDVGAKGGDACDGVGAKDGDAGDGVDTKDGDAGNDADAKVGDASDTADVKDDDDTGDAGDAKEESASDAKDTDAKESSNGDVAEDSAAKPAAEKPADAAMEVDEPGSATGTEGEPEPEAESTDSDIEEIEQTDPLAMEPGAAAAGPAREAARLVVIDTDSLMSGRQAVPAAPRPPPLTRAPPAQPPQQPQQPQPQPQTVSINPSVLQALAQYGINTAGMTGEQLAQLQDYYRRSHDDAEFVLEAPSFIVPYVMESPPEETVKQFMARVTKAADAAAKDASGGKEGDEAKVNGEASKTDGEAESDEQTKKDGNGDKDKELDSNKENKPDREAASRREEDFSHLGKWAYYYQAPVGQLLLDQGRGIVEEFIKEDLLKQQKRKAAREKGGGSEATRFAIKSLSANLAASRRKNAPFRLKMTQCRYCAFETESVLVMERHLEMPHMVGSIYQCNFCDYETRSPQVVLSHMLHEHGVQGRLERAPASFQCPLCPYEDSGKARMTRHLNSCQKKFRIEKNQALDDWVPPAKVPKIHRGRPNVLGKQFEPVRGAQAGAKAVLQQQQQQQQSLAAAAAAAAASARGRGRPVGSYKDGIQLSLQQRHQYNRQGFVSNMPGLNPPMIRSPAGPQMLMPPHYQIGNQIYQLVNNQLVPVNPSSRAGGAGSGGSGVQIIPSSGPSAPPGLSIQATSTSKTVAAAALKLSSTPSISITPVPRPSVPPSVPAILRSAAAGSQLSITKGTAGGRPDAAALSKGAFVICEICDGYIKDLEQLRNHMQWIHKVKIHPKMIYNRPPLNCQKCQLRFFTDQGLERHLLGSHGLVTSSMQEAANKGHDSGRCPICGKVYQWKLLHHVSKDHHVTLKPAHLSYKCTVCTATFSMYKQFENHVYSSHSVVAKKIMESSDRKKAAAAAAATGQPIKINDEITIIPHPGSGAAAAGGSPQAASTPVKRRRPEPAVERECELCEHRALPAPLTEHYRQCHLGRPEVEFTPLLRDPGCAEFLTDEVRRQLREHAASAASSDIEVEVSDPEDEAAEKSGGSSGGSALSKLNKEITITPISAARPRRLVTVRRPKPFMGPASARRRRRSLLAPRSVAERRRLQRETAGRRRNPSVVELSDSEPAPANTTVDLEAEDDEPEQKEEEQAEQEADADEEKMEEEGEGEGSGSGDGSGDE